MIWHIDYKRLLSEPIPDNASASKPLPLDSLRHLIPDKPSYRTLYRWTKQGAKSSSGKTVKLQSVKLPAGLGSSLASYWQFLEDLQA